MPYRPRCEGLPRKGCQVHAHVAGQLGFAIGSNRAWFAVELSIARVRALADLEMQASGSVMEHDLDQRGRVFTPAVGFLLWI